MVSNLIVRLTKYLLKKSTLSLEDKADLTATLLEKIHALPMKDVLVFDTDGTVSVAGKKMDMETAIILKEGAIAMRNNSTRRLIREQVTFNAVTLGVHKGLNTDQIMFCKAALWIMQEEDKLLSMLTEG